MPLKLAPDAPPKATDHITEERERLSRSLGTFTKRIGVHSGKGGVGKTFVACNLARLLQAEGHQVGLLDADIDCPNVHTFLNLDNQMEIDDAQQLKPVIAHGLQIVSTGFMQAPGDPLIIRGPIKHRILTDFVEKTAWTPLDYLIIDFPPGTSDVPLSAMQFFDLTGVILVTTPQKESVADVTRAASMARKLGVPLLGLIENMSGDVFGSVGEKLARELNVPLLGSIPLEKWIRETSDCAETAFLDERLAPLARRLLEKLA